MKFSKTKIKITRNSISKCKNSIWECQNSIWKCENSIWRCENSIYRGPTGVDKDLLIKTNRTGAFVDQHFSWFWCWAFVLEAGFVPLYSQHGTFLFAINKTSIYKVKWPTSSSAVVQYVGHSFYYCSARLY